MKFRYVYPFFVRQAMQVANAVAEEIENNLVWGRCFLNEEGFGSRPSCLTVDAKVNGDRATVKAHYEGGTVVKVTLLDLEEEYRPEDWWVEKVTCRYRILEDYSPAPEKTERDFSLKEISALREHKTKGWYHPHVLIEHVKS